MKDRLVNPTWIGYNKILGFAGFVANDMHGFVTLFWAPIYRVFHVVKPIKMRVVRL
jgi:hypothetical protein